MKNQKFKYSININQFACIKSGLDLDIVDLAIFDYIKDFSNTKGCMRIQEDDGDYFWISHSKLIKEMPLLSVKSKSGLIRRINKLVECDVIRKHPNSSDIGKSFYKFGDNYSKLIFAEYEESKKSTPLHKKIDPPTQKNRDPLHKKTDNNNNYNNKDYNNNNIKEEFFDFRGLKFPMSHQEHIKKFKENSISLETFMIQNGIKNESELNEMFFEFLKHLNIDGKTYTKKDFSEFRRHFVNWSRKSIENREKSVKINKNLYI